MNKNIKTYYKKRAKVYDQSMYFRDEPNRNKEIVEITKIVKKIFKDKNIIEVACGTGYWTQITSEVAKKIKATDAVREMINIAETKKYSCPVDFEISDASKLSYKNKAFDAGLANFWFSHMLKADIPKFLKEFHRVLKSGSIVFLCDNVFHKDPFETPFVEEEENGFRIRKLDGKRYKVIKNYYLKDELVKIFSSYAKNSKVNIVTGKWAWWAWYKTK